MQYSDIKKIGIELKSLTFSSASRGGGGRRLAGRGGLSEDCWGGSVEEWVLGGGARRKNFSDLTPLFRFAPPHIIMGGGPTPPAPPFSPPLLAGPFVKIWCTTNQQSFSKHSVYGVVATAAKAGEGGVEGVVIVEVMLMLRSGGGRRNSNSTVYGGSGGDGWIRKRDIRDCCNISWKSMFLFIRQKLQSMRIEEDLPTIIVNDDGGRRSGLDGSLDVVNWRPRLGWQLEAWRSREACRVRRVPLTAGCGGRHPHRANC